MMGSFAAEVDNSCCITAAINPGNPVSQKHKKLKFHARLVPRACLERLGCRVRLELARFRPFLAWRGAGWTLSLA